MKLLKRCVNECPVTLSRHHTVTMDPIGFAGGQTDLYKYLSNGPVAWVDPSGLNGEYDWAEMMLAAFAAASEGGGAAVPAIVAYPAIALSAIIGGAIGYYVVGPMIPLGTAGATRACEIANRGDRERFQKQIATRSAQILQDRLNRFGGTRKDMVSDAYEILKFIKQQGISCDTVQNLTEENVFGNHALTQGRWQPVNEQMSARARAYQQQITGRTGQSYVVRGVRFDGVTRNGLVDAKGPGYSTFVRNGQFRPWFNGQQELVRQANAQVAAARGVSITWQVAEQDAATAIQNLLIQNNIAGINVVFTPPVP